MVSLFLARRGRLSGIGRACILSGFFAAPLSGCALDDRPELEPGSAKKPAARAAPAVSTDPVVSPPPAREAARSIAPPVPQKTARVAPTDDDAGSARAPALLDGSAPQGPDATPTTDAASEQPMRPTIAPGCARDELRRRADAFMQALASGTPDTLQLHPTARYTENGREQWIGTGLWLEQPKTEFARHVLDEQSCSSVTEAVLSEPLRRLVFGVRLRYAQDRLLDIEAQVVPPSLAYFNPDAIIPKGDDPWLQPIDPVRRMSADELLGVARNYFESIVDSKLLPPSATSCKLRQNGADANEGGSCAAVPGEGRYEQMRYPVVDVSRGIVTGVGIHRGYLGMFLIKVVDGVIQNIDIVGGAASQSTGW